MRSVLPRPHACADACALCAPHDRGAVRSSDDSAEPAAVARTHGPTVTLALACTDDRACLRTFAGSNSEPKSRPDCRACARALVKSNGDSESRPDCRACARALVKSNGESESRPDGNANVAANSAAHNRFTNSGYTATHFDDDAHGGTGSGAQSVADIWSNDAALGRAGSGAQSVADIQSNDAALGCADSCS